jgi:LSD1 subclass zinc finger protein
MNCIFTRIGDQLVCLRDGCHRSLPYFDGAVAVRCAGEFSEDEVERFRDLAIRAGRFVPLDAGLAMRREKDHCALCPFWVADRNLEKPACVLLDCPSCSAGIPADEKAKRLANKWATHLANPQSSCLLADKPKWGPEPPPAKDYCQMNAHGVVIDASQVQ